MLAFLFHTEEYQGKHLTVSVVTLALLTLTLFFCGAIVHSLEAKQALELQTVDQAERQ